MLLLILIRHAERSGSEPDNLDPLTVASVEACKKLAVTLDQTGIRPQFILSSKYRHAMQTAKLLVDHNSKVIELESLTPKNELQKWTLEDVLAECGEKGIQLEEATQILIVGHEPRLSQLLTQLTSERLRPFDRMEVIAVEGENLISLRLGKGRPSFRYPVNDFMEGKLQSKIQSKMQVATLLAGFTFTTLSSVVLSGQIAEFSLRTVFGFGCMVSALFLFIASIYIYDRLSMPSGFWIYEHRPTRKGSIEFRKELQQNGRQYTYMIRTWNFVFTPAVISSLVGFILLLLSIKDCWLRVILPGSTIGLFFIVLIYYFLMRPKLATD